jgi:arginine repressor
MRVNLANQAIRDALFSAWSSGDEILKFCEIVKYLNEKGIINRKNKMTVSRWLKKLETEKVIEKVSLKGGKRQGYKLKLKPSEYHLFDYLNELRKKFSKKK